MAVLGAHAVVLEVPDLKAGIRFYTDAGLESESDGKVGRLSCAGQGHDCIVLIGGAPRKRLHHIALRADRLGDIAANVPATGGRVIDAPEGFDDCGLWVTDPNGMLIHLIEHAAEPELETARPFEINAPGRVTRIRRSAILPKAHYAPVKPLRLGHVLVFSPDVCASVKFFTEALGMGLADRAQDVIAFTCARRNSDHHVVAFAKSSGVGFHHVSLQLADPDSVGRGGRALAEATGRGDWGMGRHTIGSNFFHYIQDPWGSWFEYYADMDYIDDYALWTPTNYAMEDSLASWAPAVPADFVHNYEIDQEQAFA